MCPTSCPPTGSSPPAPTPYPTVGPLSEETHGPDSIRETPKAVSTLIDVDLLYKEVYGPARP